MKKYLSVKYKKSLKSMDKHHLTDDEKREAHDALLKAERSQPIQMRRTVGDASESGLVKFAHSINDIDLEREKYPTFTFEQEGKPTEALIPFNSEIKFNLFIRDM